MMCLRRECTLAPRHLTNTSEQSVRGGDTALCQIALTTCYYEERRKQRTVIPTGSETVQREGDGYQQLARGRSHVELTCGGHGARSRRRSRRRRVDRRLAAANCDVRGPDAGGRRRPPATETGQVGGDESVDAEVGQRRIGVMATRRRKVMDGRICVTAESRQHAHYIGSLSAGLQWDKSGWELRITRRLKELHGPREAAGARLQWTTWTDDERSRLRPRRLYCLVTETGRRLQMPPRWRKNRQGLIHLGVIYVSEVTAVIYYKFHTPPYWVVRVNHTYGVSLNLRISRPLGLRPQSAIMFRNRHMPSQFQPQLLD